MTLRRVFVLARALPPTSWFWSSVRDAAEKAKVAKPEQIRDRAEHYRKRARAQRGRTT